MNNCVFCAIGRFDEDVIRGTVLRDLPSAYIMEPLNPVTKGHVLVIPRVHVSDALDSPRVTGDIMEVAANYARNVGPCNIITSVGREASQTVMHFHVHIVPRHKGDGLALPWGKLKENYE